MRIETPQAVVVRLCELVEHVARYHIESVESTDCFCKEGGFWRNDYDPVEAGTWRHDDVAIRYIEETVLARLAVERRVKPLRRRLALLWRAVKP